MYQVIRQWDEQRFWLEILQDHAYFVRDHLSVSEAEYVKVAQQYIDQFGEFLTMLDQIGNDAQPKDEAMIRFSRMVWPFAKGYFDFEGRLQALRIENKVNLNLSPTYLNGTLAENQEYLRLLNYWVHGKEADPLPLVDLMDLWLEDQLGHALLFRYLLDPIELEWARKTDGYIQRYEGYMIQNRHLKGYLRFTNPGFPKQQEFAHDVGKTTLEFRQFIFEALKKFNESQLLNKTTLRFLEHHFPETCYFIKYLSFYAPMLQKDAKECSLLRSAYHLK